MSRKKISTTVYLTPEQQRRLKALHTKTRIPMAEYVREGIARILVDAEAGLWP